MSSFPSIKTLKKKGIPYAIIAGLITAHLLGWDGKALNAIKNYHETRALFPTSGVVEVVEDGDTFILTNGIIVRLVGVNAPDKGQANYQTAMHKLYDLVIDKRVYLEYDRYQDDKFTRVLAWVWTDCESTPKFLPADYMYKSGNESNPGLKENPEGCKNGKLVNEELVRSGLAIPVIYKDRGPTKYETRINSIKSP